jgi:hypothetical protein
MMFISVLPILGFVGHRMSVECLLFQSANVSLEMWGEEEGGIDSKQLQISLIMVGW